MTVRKKNTCSKQKKLPGNKLSRIDHHFGWIGLALGVLFWVIESAIHAFVFVEGTFVQQLTAPSANEIWMRSLVVCLFIGFGVYANWITKRLSESNRRMREMMANVQLAAVMLQSDGTIAYVNDHLLEMTGYARDEILGGNWFDIFVPPDDREQLREVHGNVLAGNLEAVGRYENEILTKNAERRIVSWSNAIFHYSPDGNVVGTTSFGEDITDRRQAEEELRESEERFRMMMEQSPSVIEFYDLDGLQIDVNRAYEELWGFPASNTVNIFNLLESKEVEETGLMDYVKKAYAGQAVAVPEYEFDPSGETEGRGLGRKRWLSTRIYPLEDANGNVKNIVITHENITERKQAEQALRQSEDRFRRAVLESPFPIMIHAEDGEVLQINKVWTELTGYEADEIPTLSAWTERAYGERKDIVKSRIDKIFDHDAKTEEGEYVISSRDGKKLVWDFSSAPLGILPDGRRVVISMAMDVTGRKRAEEELNRLSRQNQLILNAAGEGIYGLDLDGNTTFVNPAAAHMIGWEIGEIVGKNQHDLLHHTKSDGTPYPAGVCPIYAAYKDGNTHHVEDEVFWRKDGSCFPVEYISTPIRSNNGVIEGAVVTFKDITERKRAEEEIRSLARFPSENPNPVLRISGDGAILYANVAAPMLLNAWGGNGEKILSESYRQTIKEVLDSGKSSDIESYCPSGRTFSVVLVPVSDGGYVNVYGRDITDRKKVQEQLRRHRAEMAHVTRLTTVGEMASSLAHELNQPLCATMTHAEGCIRMLKSDSLDREKFAAKLDTIVRQSERAGKIISRVHGFVRKGKPTRTTVQMNQIIRETCELLEIAVHNVRAEILLDLDSEVGGIIVDPVQIEQVLLNLAQNGLDAMKDLPPAQRKLTICSSLSDGRVKVSVSDTGSGIAQGHVGRIFEAFFTTKGDGLGMGLSISRSIIESHGGRMSLIANCDRGATFGFSLPLVASCEVSTVIAAR